MSHAKISLITLCLFLTFSASSNQSSTIGFGLGVEYGGLGARIYIPIGVNNFELYTSAGLFSYSTETNEEFGAGIGLNYHITDNSSMGIYTGVVNIDNEYQHNSLDYSTSYDIGGSINYTYHFSGKNNTGFSIGGSYNFYDNGSYPFISFGYRF
ncbi:hypothetical protein VXM60_01790 [Shewanella khirikhana]|uniref:hypothetical protein n=1 Tax=Shewanella khirikhana TaxID=1965282 RepID=UPI0030CCCA48